MIQINPVEFMKLVDEYTLSFVRGMEYIDKYNIPLANQLELVEKFIETPADKLRKISSDYFKMLMIYNKLSETMGKEELENMFIDEFINMAKEVAVDYNIK